MLLKNFKKHMKNLHQKNIELLKSQKEKEVLNLKLTSQNKKENITPAEVSSWLQIFITLATFIKSLFKKKRI